MRTDPLL